MLGLSPSAELNFVNEARIWVTLVAALAAGGTVGLTYAQVRLQRTVAAEKDAAATEATARSNERIAQAEAEGARARADAEQAAARVAEMQVALGKAAAEQERLRLEVERAHLETLRLQAGLASRRLSAAQAEALSRALSPLATTIPSIWILSAGEMGPAAFRDDIAVAFRGAGIEVEVGENTMNPPQYGVVLYDTPDGAGEPVARAMRQAGVQVQVVPNSSARPVMRVGLKPPSSDARSGPFPGTAPERGGTMVLASGCRVPTSV